MKVGPAARERHGVVQIQRRVDRQDDAAALIHSRAVHCSRAFLELHFRPRSRVENTRRVGATIVQPKRAHLRTERARVVKENGIPRADHSDVCEPGTRALLHDGTDEVVESPRAARRAEVVVIGEKERARVVDRRAVIQESGTGAREVRRAVEVHRASVEDHIAGVAREVPQRAHGDFRHTRSALRAAGPAEIVAHRQSSRAGQSASALSEREDARIARKGDGRIRIQDRGVARAGHYVAGPVGCGEPIGVPAAACVPRPRRGGGDDAGELRRIEVAALRRRSGNHPARWDEAV